MGISFLIYTLLIDVHSVRTQLWRKTRLGVKINQHYQHIHKIRIRSQSLACIFQRVAEKNQKLQGIMHTEHKLPTYQYFMYGTVQY